MKRYWWVNHNQTFSHEISGGYLWSPKREKNLARSKFYDNMKEAAPGDIVLSFANSRISFIGIVQEFAISSSKPGEFGNVGHYWGSDGWLLPMKWDRLSKNVRPKEFISKLSDLLPEKYSPINPTTGNGNQKAYLAEISLDVLLCILAEVGIRPNELLANGAADRQAANPEELSLI